MSEIYLEAESCSDLGGWVVDTQSMETIHSSYIMAHGMGVPVKDATLSFEVSESGGYNIWALTRDWTAVWNVKDPAGKWKLKVDGKELSSTLGTESPDWSWQKCGQIELSRGTHTLSFCDLTGFNARCDAVYLTTSQQVPSNDVSEIDKMRSRLSEGETENCETEYDLIVIGAGIAGICLSLSAIRMGVKTLLIHDRSVLGGCNSSEIRVCMGGKINLPPYSNIGNVVREIAPVMGSPSLFDKRYYEDDRKQMAFEASDALNNVLCDHFVCQVEKKDGKITAVVAKNTLTGKKTRFYARLFADCSGDAIVSRLAGAEVLYGRESANEFDETLAPQKGDKTVMGHSIRWYTEKADENSNFPVIDWGLEFNEQTYLDVLNGDWEQECGFRRDMVKEIEYIRDFGLRAIYSNWSYQKNRHSDKYGKYKLKWVSPIGGKRESYRVVGDHILNQNDIENHIEYEDTTSAMTWSIDLHFPECDNDKLFDEPFRSFAYHRGIVKPYFIPYRCLYSKDIDNLFLGGRLVSATHVAFSSVRVMRTLGQLGEVAGLASSICRKYDCTPREVYTKFLPELKELLKAGVPIPCAFCCEVGDEEEYHFKDAGWLELKPYRCDEKYLEKFKRGIKTLNIKHKYPLPEKLK